VSISEYNSRISLGE